MMARDRAQVQRRRLRLKSFWLCGLMFFCLALPRLKAQTVLETVLQKKVSSVISKREFKRLQRYRPLPPFDESPFYSFLDIPLEENNKKPSLLGRILSDILVGPSFQLTPKLKLSLDGLIYLLPDYSRKEGLWLGYEAMFEYKIGLGKKLILRTSNNYTTKSRNYYHEHKLYYYFNPEQDGLLLLSGGQTSRETLPETKSEIYTQKFINPLGTNNSLRDYKKSFVSLRGTQYLSPKLNATLSLLYEDREPCFDPNLSGSKLLLAEANLLYDFAPKAPMLANYPTSIQLPYGFYSLALGLNIKQAFRPSFLKANVNEQFKRYTMLEGTLRSAWADNVFRHRLALFGGGFFRNGEQGLLDSRHFRSISIVMPATFDNAWATLPNYYLLDKQWGGFYWTGTSQKFLLTRTFLGTKGLGFDESLHLKYITDLNNQNYAEFGYSIGWDNFFRLGVFLGTDFTRRRPNWQFAVNIPITLLMSQWGERY